MLLWNLRASPGYGPCNRTRMIVLTLDQRVVEVEISSEVNRGNYILILHITIAPSDTELPFTLEHHQFPLCPCFAMATNKAEGKHCSLWAFTCQLMCSLMANYMLLSVEFRTPSTLAVCLNNPDRFMRNIVFQEVL